MGAAAEWFCLSNSAKTVFQQFVRSWLTRWLIGPGRKSVEEAERTPDREGRDTKTREKRIGDLFYHPPAKLEPCLPTSPAWPQNWAYSRRCQDSYSPLSATLVPSSHDRDVPDYPPGPIVSTPGGFWLIPSTGTHQAPAHGVTTRATPPISGGRGRGSHLSDLPERGGERLRLSSHDGLTSCSLLTEVGPGGQVLLNGAFRNLRSTGF